MILMKKLYFKGIGLPLISWYDSEVIFLHDPFYNGAFVGAGVFVEGGSLCWVVILSKGAEVFGYAVMVSFAILCE